VGSDGCRTGLTVSAGATRNDRKVGSGVAQRACVWGEVAPAADGDARRRARALGTRPGVPPDGTGRGKEGGLLLSPHLSPSLLNPLLSAIGSAP
jgi:hypothetical protein